MRLAIDQVDFHPLSIADPGGRVFCHDQQIYRAVTPARADWYRTLFDRGILDALINRGWLIPTEVDPGLEVQGHAMVLKHRRVRTVTYAAEWPLPMLKSAALLVLDLLEALHAENLTLLDGHPFNVLFEHVTPVFVDVGSIVAARPSGHWPAFDEFRRFFINPLKLMSAGHTRVARLLLTDAAVGVGHAETAALTGTPPWQAPPHLPVTDAIAMARREIAELPINSPTTEWSRYTDDCFPAFEATQGWNAKHHAVSRFLSKTKPAAVLDIGANRGWFSQLAARLGAVVVAADLDEPALNQLYQDALAHSLPIQPTVMNFVQPLPGFGIDNSLMQPALARLRCQLVLALAVVHHLCCRQMITFELFVSALSQLTQRWLIVEFIEPTDIHVSRWNNKPQWYTLENFRSKLQKSFVIHEQTASDIDHRWILLCEKK